MSYQEAVQRIKQEADKPTGMLNLSWLELDTLPNEIQKLANLTFLDLSHNRITDISPLKKLTNLTSLDLNSNRVLDISWLTRLTNLTSLSLNTNRITSIKPLGELINLKTLSINSNKILDINSLEKLTNLTSLSLSDNRISNISALKPLIKKSLSIGFTTANRDINVGNNPLTFPPSEIIKQGTEAVINYFAQLEVQEQDYLFEAKLLILGEGGAGKTTFARKIRNNHAGLPEDKDTTKGIDVHLWEFDLTESDLRAAGKTDLLEHADQHRLLEKRFYVNLWDFGGQEIYHATHRFFLSGRSLYVLLSDGRKQETDYNYWLNILEQLGGKSPLIVVVNEKHGQSWQIDEQGLKGRYAFLKETRNIDLADGNNLAKLEELRETIRACVTRLPHIGDPLPESWTAIRAALAAETLPFISQDRYLEICRESRMTDLKQALWLSQYFHDIGVFLHYQKDEVLKNRIFLNPNWITRTVYSLLNDKQIQDNYGRFNMGDVERIWDEEKIFLIHSDLLKLLERFKLAYCIDNTENYIAPEHLPEQKPYNDWEYKEDLLILSYEFDAFMPKGLMNELIVELHRFIPDHKRVWRRGVVLKRKEAWAEVTQAYGNEFRFDIKVAGSDKKELLIIIVEEFDKILERLPKLFYEKLVPCNCNHCRNTQNKHFYKLSDLKRRLKNKKETIDCPKNNDKSVPIRPLLKENEAQELKQPAQVRTLIANNKLGKAFEILTTFDSHQTAKLQQQWIHLEDEYQKGSLDYKLFQNNMSTLTERMLRLTQVEQQEPAPPWEPTLYPGAQGKKKWYERVTNAIPWGSKKP